MFHFLFGSYCLVCRFENKNYKFVCSDCRKKIENYFIKDFIEGTFVIFSYKGPIRGLILNGKYRFNRYIWKFWEAYLEDLPFKKNNIILYVPTTFKRFCFRGFNQSYLIAKGLEKAGYGKVVSIIERTVFNKSTSLLGKEQRQTHIKDNFNMKKNFEEFLEQNVLLVDDVMTTGSTLAEIEKLLVVNGFPKDKIQKFTLASGRLNDD